MKKLIVIIAYLCSCISVNAQISQLTETQKNEALRVATEFCNLFSRWCNGERTLEQSINALCSGKDCSAYDDVSLNKETTLRNYLLGIQKKYPRKMSVSLSAPSLFSSSIAYEPNLSLVQQIRPGDDPLEASSINKIKTNSYKNAYVVFNINQTTSAGTKQKKLIYDINSSKITAFVSGDGTFISFLGAISDMEKGNYKSAINKFEFAAQNDRASLKKNCYICCMACCIYMEDIEGAKKYAKLSNNPLLIKWFSSIDLMAKEQWCEVLKLMLECEQLALKSTEGKGMLPYVYMYEGLYYSKTNENNGEPNFQKSLYYFRKAINGGNIMAAYLLFNLALRNDEYDEYMEEGELMQSLRFAAENNHPAAILWMGCFAEVDPELMNNEDPAKWFKKGADNGDPICKARLGRYFINKGGSYTTEGKKLLREALASDKFDAQLDYYKKETNGDFWPQSREDLQKLIGSSTSSSSTSLSSGVTSYQTPSNSSVSSSTTHYSPSSNSSNSSYSNSSYYHTRYRKPFNHKQDNYSVGWTFSYIQKQWVYEDEEGKEYIGLFDDDKFVNGFQTGLRIDPQFGYGFGMNSGLFYEYCWAKSKDDYDDYGKYHLTYEEHGLYIPMHLKYNMNFSKWFQVSFYGGVSGNYVFSGRAYTRDEGETYGSQDLFEDDDWSRFNFMLEYGVAIRCGWFQIDATISKGLNDWSKSDGMKLKQGRPLTISATFCF